MSPGWRTGLAAWQWVELTSANFDAVGPSFDPGATLVGGYRKGRIDAWNGMVAMDATVVMAGIGGHSDWGGNEGYSVDLSASAPVWTMLGAPTPEAKITIDTTYYGDGRPTSAHTYYSLHADVVRKKIFRMGAAAAYGTGNFSRPTVDAFDIAKQNWDAAATWPSVPEALDYAKSQAQDPTTGDVFVVGNTKLWRFNRTAGVWVALASVPNNGTAAYYRASVVDTKRQLYVVLGDAYRPGTGILVYDIAKNTWNNTLSLGGSYASTVAAQSGHVAFYNATIDKYVVKTGSAGDVILVDPVTLSTSLASTSNSAAVPSPQNGVFGKFVYVASLNGYAYQPRGDSKLWFLAAP